MQKMLRDRVAFQGRLDSLEATGLGDDHPEVKKIRLQLRGLDSDIEILRKRQADAKRIDRPGEYYVSGDIHTAGVFSLVNGKPLTLKQFLTSTGTAEKYPQHYITMKRNGHSNVLFRNVPMKQCLEGVLADVEIAANDVIEVKRERTSATRPATQPAPQP